MATYDTAQVCLGGHMVNDRYTSDPSGNQNFCDQCGEKTITECVECQHPIRGDMLDSSVIGFINTPPAYCLNCGIAFPWTDRKINAAVVMSVEAGELNEEDAETMRQSLQDMSRNNPEAQVGLVRFDKLLKKMPGAAAKAVRDIGVEVAAEVIVKSMNGGQQ